MNRGSLRKTKNYSFSKYWGEAQTSLDSGVGQFLEFSSPPWRKVVNNELGADALMQAPPNSKSNG